MRFLLIAAIFSIAFSAGLRKNMKIAESKSEGKNSGTPYYDDGTSNDDESNGEGYPGEYEYGNRHYDDDYRDEYGGHSVDDNRGYSSNDWDDYYFGRSHRNRDDHAALLDDYYYSFSFGNYYYDYQFEYDDEKTSGTNDEVDAGSAEGSGEEEDTPRRKNDDNVVPDQTAVEDDVTEPKVERIRRKKEPETIEYFYIYVIAACIASLVLITVGIIVYHFSKIRDTETQRAMAIASSRPKTASNVQMTNLNYKQLSNTEGGDDEEEDMDTLQDVDVGESSEGGESGEQKEREE